MVDDDVVSPPESFGPTQPLSVSLSRWTHLNPSLQKKPLAERSEINQHEDIEDMAHDTKE